MQRVGWIRIGALGDLLVGLASLRETLDQWPSAKVTVIGPSLWLQILEPGFWPQIDRVVVVEKRGSDAVVYECKGERAGAGWSRQDRGAWTLNREMRSGYDVVVNARVDSPRQGFAAFWARVPERWGSADGIARFIYNRRAPHDGKDPLIHERDVPLLMMDEAAATAAGDRNYVGKTLPERIALSPRIRKWRTKGLPTPRHLDLAKVKAVVGTDRYFVVNPTSSRREKAWPTVKFYEFLLEIERRGVLPGVKPIVVGAPHESEWLKEVARDRFQIVQPSSMAELFDVISGAEVLLTNTSSVQFIAASVGTRTMTLMGRARPEIWGPLGPRDQFVLGKEPIDVESIFVREQKAYESIEVETVVNKLSSLLAKA